jgi:hypothetical protein
MMTETGSSIAPNTPQDAHDPSLSRPRHTVSLPSSTDLRMMELEMENSRLQRLVAELLFKNQQLRKEQE